MFKFKIGDKVRVYKTILSEGSATAIGQVGTVIKQGIHRYGNCYVLDIKLSKGGIYENELELYVKPEPIVYGIATFCKEMYK